MVAMVGMSSVEPVWYALTFNRIGSFRSARLSKPPMMYTEVSFCLDGASALIIDLNVMQSAAKSAVKFAFKMVRRTE
jgi:hypothetical protein